MPEQRNRHRTSPELDIFDIALAAKSSDLEKFTICSIATFSVIVKDIIISKTRVKNIPKESRGHSPGLLHSTAHWVGLRCPHHEDDNAVNVFTGGCDDAQPSQGQAVLSNVLKSPLQLFTSNAFDRSTNELNSGQHFSCS